MLPDFLKFFAYWLILMLIWKATIVNLPEDSSLRNGMLSLSS